MHTPTHLPVTPPPVGEGGRAGIVEGGSLISAVSSPVTVHYTPSTDPPYIDARPYLRIHCLLCHSSSPRVLQLPFIRIQELPHQVAQSLRILTHYFIIFFSVCIIIHLLFRTHAHVSRDCPQYNTFLFRCCTVPLLHTYIYFLVHSFNNSSS